MPKITLTFFSKILFVVVLVLSILLTIIKFDSQPQGMDEIGHYYIMRLNYDNLQFPTTGAYLQAQNYIKEINAARVPGGYFFWEYMIHFAIGGEDLYFARFSYSITMFLAALIFLFWVFKRFGVITLSIVATLILVNSDFLRSNYMFYNPHPVLMFSFLFLPLLAEYMVQKKPFVPAMLLFPVLALMWHSHFAVFFSAIITLIVYLIIKWNEKTKYNIKPFAIGIFISFLTYLPYLITEIQNGFINTSLLLGRKDEIAELAISFQPTQLHTILLFPTNEPNRAYNGIGTFLSHWILNDNHIMKFLFIFYIISIIFMALALFISFKHFFKKSIQFENKENASMLKELLFFMLIYFITTFVMFNIFGIGSGRSHYFYSAYTLSFVPIIYLIQYLQAKKNKLLKYIFIFVFINAFILFIVSYLPTINYKPYDNWYVMGETFKVILEDSKGQEFSFDSTKFRNEVGKGYLGIENWKSNPNAELEYVFRNSYENEDRFTNMTLIFSNEYHKIFKHHRTNINIID